MALLKTLRSLTRNPNPRSLLSSFHGSASPLPSPSNPAAVSGPVNPFSFIHRSRLFSPIVGEAPFPFSGPLFLSLPAWKLSQSATPLYLRGKGAAFPRDLLARRSFPVELGLRSVGEAGRGDGGDGLGLKREEHNEIQEVGGEERFLNLPNLVSISRMVSGPFIGWMIMNEWYFTSFCGLVVSGATDWLDGFLARKMGINSVFGSYLDPLADKVLIGCVALAMVKKDLLHPALVGLLVLRDVALVSGAVYKRASSLGWEWKSWADFINLDATNREKVEPLLISKVNTVFQLLLVGCAILQPEFGTEETQLYITYLSWLVASTTVASFAAYGAQHLRKTTASAAEKWSGSSSKFS